MGMAKGGVFWIFAITLMLLASLLWVTLCRLCCRTQNRSTLDTFS